MYGSVVFDQFSIFGADVTEMFQMSESSTPWRSKRLCLIFIQHLALANIFLIAPNLTEKDSKDNSTSVEGDKEKLMKCIRNIILRLLKDDKLEVR